MIEFLQLMGDIVGFFQLLGVCLLCSLGMLIFGVLCMTFGCGPKYDPDYDF